MLAFIEGEIVQKNPDGILVANKGIGYHLQCDSGLVGTFPAVGQKAKVWTYMNVRENEISLYAFPSQEIKSLFELLITVSGIGPKVAGTIVASITPDAFALAVMNDNHRLLTKIKGIGPKSSQRIVLELKDKLKKTMPKLEVETMVGADANLLENQNLLGVRREALAALMVLGYAEREAEVAVDKAYQESQSEEGQVSTEDLLKLALQHLSVL